MKIRQLIIILLAVFTVAETNAIQFEPDFWKNYADSLKTVNGFAVRLDAHVKKVTVPDDTRLNTFGIMACLQVLQTYVTTEFKDKPVIKREIDKAIKTNVMLAAIAAELSHATVIVFAYGKLGSDERSKLLQEYSKTKEVIEKINNDSNIYLGKLVELLQ